MNKKITVAFAIAALALAPLTAFAWASKAEVENYCTQEAEGKGVAAAEVADYVAKCVATNWKDEKEIETEVKEEKSE